ncbi:nickel/cobalt transporter [Amorphus sp. MBR-141]
MSARGARAAGTTLAAALVLVALLAPAMAAGGPFGVGAPEPTAAPMSGPLGPVFAWVAAWQTSFYRLLTDSIAEMKASGAAPWLLIALSFGYGVFHAVGPGHGKAVISSYMMANEATAKRALGLSFAASAVQATTAVVLVLVGALVLNLSSIALSRSVETIEIAAYSLVTALGAVLVWRKIVLPLARRRRPAHGIVAAGPLSAALAADAMPPVHAHHEAHAARDGPHHHDHHHHHHHGEAEACGCGHVHALDPAMVAEAGTAREMAAAVLSIGLRPCTGAVIVLVFALAQGLPMAGILSAYAMGLGTAVTVSVLALAAVGAKGLAVRLSGPDSRLAARVHAGIEAGAAVMVLVLGALLLGATLSMA